MLPQFSVPVKALMVPPPLPSPPMVKVRAASLKFVRRTVPVPDQAPRSAMSAPTPFISMTQLLLNSTTWLAVKPELNFSLEPLFV